MAFSGRCERTRSRVGASKTDAQIRWLIRSSPARLIRLQRFLSDRAITLWVIQARCLELAACRPVYGAPGCKVDPTPYLAVV